MLAGCKTIYIFKSNLEVAVSRSATCYDLDAIVAAYRLGHGINICVLSGQRGLLDTVTGAQSRKVMSDCRKRFFSDKRVVCYYFHIA